MKLPLLSLSYSFIISCAEQYPYVFFHNTFQLAFNLCPWLLKNKVRSMWYNSAESIMLLVNCQRMKHIAIHFRIQLPFHMHHSASLGIHEYKNIQTSFSMFDCDVWIQVSIIGIKYTVWLKHRSHRVWNYLIYPLKLLKNTSGWL